MIDASAKDLIARGHQLFEKRKPLLSLWQDISEHFYPERADYTVGRSLGSELAENLMTSYPVLARRDLANTFSSMLRPKDKDWFFLRPAGMTLSVEGQRFLDNASQTQRRAMYDTRAGFVRATKQTDNDYATVGQGVIKVDLIRKTNTMLYRNLHLRDVVWAEGVDGFVNEVHWNWTPTAQQLIQLFGKNKVHPKVIEIADKNKFQEIRCRHVVIESESYGGAKVRQPYMSLYIDIENEHIIEQVGQWNLGYVVPRWQTVAGSQYAYSPATVVALADARLIQAMTLTLLEAGEHAVKPPLIAQDGMIKGNVEMYPGGITWIDSEYDERLGEALRPLRQDTAGIPLGIEMQRDIKNQIAEAFYLNKIGLPPITKEMTAFEVGQRVSEYVRQALPLFEPMEVEYNGALCEITFDILMRNGAFGPVDDIPRELRGMDIPFIFESPLQEAKEHQKGQRFLETKAMLAEAALLDQSVKNVIDVKTALRDVLSGIGTPAAWVRSDEEQKQLDEADEEVMQAQQMMAALAQGGAAAEQIGKGGQELQKMGVV